MCVAAKLEVVEQPPSQDSHVGKTIPNSHGSFGPKVNFD